MSLTPEEIRFIVRDEIAVQFASLGIKPKKQRRQHIFRINFNGENFTGITDKDYEAWQAAYPGVAIPAAIRQAATWVQVNNKQCRNWARFLVNWFAKSQRVADGRVS